MSKLIAGYPFAHLSTMTARVAAILAHEAVEAAEYVRWHADPREPGLMKGCLIEVETAASCALLAADLAPNSIAADAARSAYGRAVRRYVAAL